MTTDKPKCEHVWKIAGDHDSDHTEPSFDEDKLRAGVVECAQCGQRFLPEPPFTGTAQAILERHANSVTVPSDVLEEARRILRKNENGSQYREEYCIECAGDMGGEGHDAGCRLKELLARIDGVLGK